MPELPEVETVVRDLRPHVLGRRLARVKVSPHKLRLPWSKSWNRALAGRSVDTISRRGKWIVADLSGGAFLVIHLGMTGQLTSTDRTAPLLDHTHFVFDLEPDPRQLRFRDIRRFGGIRYFADAARLGKFFDGVGLGPEPFALEESYWRSCLARTNRCLKAVLLDQSVVAGVGNIYADESLFEARLHPTRLGRELSHDELRRLLRAITRVLTRAIDRRGSTIQNYIGGSGLRGEYQDEFRVYGRHQEPCRRCRSPIGRIRLAGRSTHFCPQCQPAVSSNPHAAKSAS